MSFVFRVSMIFLIMFDFFTMIGFPVAFVFLYSEFKAVLGPCIMKIKHKMILYCVLMSLLMIGRFTYFFVLQVEYVMFLTEEIGI